MESVISIVVVIAIYSLIAIVKTLLFNSGGVEAKPIMEEAFPTVEHIEPEEQPAEEPVVSEPVVQRPFETSPKIVVKNRTEKPSPLQETIHIVDEQPVKEDKHRLEKVMMKSKSDAKRAFIYSEVFNRKY